MEDSKLKFHLMNKDHTIYGHTVCSHTPHSMYVVIIIVITVYTSKEYKTQGRLTITYIN